MRNMIVLSLLIIAAAQDGEPALTFKGATLGMSLDTFKAVAAGSNVTFPAIFDEPKKKPRKGYLTVDSPYCSDTSQGVRALQESQPDGLFSGLTVDSPDGLVTCGAPTENATPWGMTVGGVQMRRIGYRFYKGRLSSISLVFTHSGYSSVAEGFRLKYGPETSKTSTPYQNAYGAHWVGEVLRWNMGSQTIVIDEGDGGGPGQDLGRLAVASLQDSKLEPKRTTARPTDF